LLDCGWACAEVIIDRGFRAAVGSYRVCVMLVGPDSWIWLALGAIVILGILQAARPKWSLLIVACPEGVVSHRGLPKSQEGRILSFIENDLTLDGRVTIRAARGRDGRLRMAFSGRLDPGTRQRVRNFLNGCI
jgi:hypothetical protein